MNKNTNGSVPTFLPGIAVLVSFIVWCLPVHGASPEKAAGYEERADVRAFIADLSQREGFDPRDLSRLFASVERQDSILKAIARPAEAKPWYEYRKIFLTPARIEGGAQFYAEHRETLERASKDYGVAPEVIVAIIGVETLYGTRTGKHRVLDALTTLGFDYEPRKKFFRRELEEFLLLSREESLDSPMVKGSYAGAMGIGQFIPSSYRAYAVDFDGDGKRDLWNPVDAIGSVASYFSRHGWRNGEVVTAPASVTGNGHRKLLKKGTKPAIPSESLNKAGVVVEGVDLNGHKVALLEYDSNGEEKEFWIGFHNFYVITRYNRSQLYAMAVHQLSEEIARTVEASEEVAKQ
ncbi:MAG: lytic murein transglycosylase B [Pseudomonadota bacterium]|nr:lytic murein transglycosylase B [Pseudomonadota bacterium]